MVAVAHGSRDPRAAAVIGDLLTLVRDRAAAGGLPGLDARAAFLDHAAPSLPAALGSLSPDHSACVVVPVLLTSAYHAEKDIPAQTAKVRSAYPGLEVTVADPLAPHPLVIDALGRRLREAWSGPPGETSVVLASAGTSDPSANATIAALAADMAATDGWRRVTAAYASAAGPTPAEVAAAADGPVVVATCLLAPGYFADKIRRTSLAAGAAAVSGPLGAAPEIADVIVGRYRDKLGGLAVAPLAVQALLRRTDHPVSSRYEHTHGGVWKVIRDTPWRNRA